jgi:hypothetical protein
LSQGVILNSLTYCTGMRETWKRGASERDAADSRSRF